MEQNSSFYSKHHYLAVQFAQHKAAILIFFFFFFAHRASHKFFLQLLGLQDGLNYTLVVGMLFFFLCWNRNILKIQLRINVIVMMCLKGFNLGIFLCWLCWLSDFIEYLIIRYTISFPAFFPWDWKHLVHPNCALGKRSPNKVANFHYQLERH